MPDEELHGTETTETVSAETEAETSESSADETAETGAEAAETTETETEQTKKEQFVPLAALHEERGKRKELAAKLEETARQNAAEMARLQERTNIILQAIQQATTPPETSKDPLFIQQFMAANPGVSKEQAEEAFLKEEPTNYLKYRQDQLAEQQKILLEQSKQGQQVTRAQEQFGQFMSVYQAKSAEFAAQTPDFKEAYNFLLTNRDAELQEMGFTDPVQRQQIMRNEEIGIVDQAFRNNINPAQRLYQIAKFRGYKAAAPGSPGVPANLDTEKKVAAATKSLSNAPGAPAGTLNAEALLSMSDDEFAKMTSGDNWSKFFRGELKA